MEYNYKVYAHINKTNGKIYVGITCKSLKQRWRNGKGYNGYFGRAINKYGWDGFEHELIASGLTRQEACNFEVLLIKELQSNNSKYGYNITMGGDSGRKGLKASEEYRRKISISRKGKYLGENSPTWGLKRPDLSRRNLEGGKTVVQYDFDGKFIEEYPSIRDAARESNNHKNGIAQSCKGVYIQAYGFFGCLKTILIKKN